MLLRNIAKYRISKAKALKRGRCKRNHLRNLPLLIVFLLLRVLFLLVFPWSCNLTFNVGIYANGLAFKADGYPLDQRSVLGLVPYKAIHWRISKATLENTIVVK